MIFFLYLSSWWPILFIPNRSGTTAIIISADVTWLFYIKEIAAQGISKNLVKK
tara:strand:+ start:780 stop:938 length:159 start_codon:yes stop_codon:yes gene_type:complete